MTLRSISIFAFIALLVSSTPIIVPRGAGLFAATPAVAQTPTDLKAEADRLFQQGNAQFEGSQFQAAIDSWHQALRRYRAIDVRKAFPQESRQGEAKSLDKLGIVYHDLDQFQQAIEYLQQAVTIQREIGDRSGEASSLCNLGIAYHNLGIAYYNLYEFQKATEYLKQALTIQHEIGDRSGEASSLNDLADAYLFLHQYRQAVEFYQQALTIARNIGNRRKEVNSLNGLGSAYRFLGQYQKAIEFCQQALILARSISNRRKEAISLNGLGSAYRFLGQDRRAIEFYQQSLAIARSIGDRQGEMAFLANLGFTYAVPGDSQKAIELHQQSLAIAREIGSRHGEGISLGNLGNAYFSLGQYQQAIDFHQQSLVIMREIGHRSGEGTSLRGLGNAYFSLGQYQQAIDFHQQSLTIEREIGHRFGEGASLRGLGNAYDSLGQYQQAIDFHQQSLAIMREIGARSGEATSLGNLGNAYDSLGQYQQAIDFHQQSLVIEREVGNRHGEGASLSSLGNAYLSLGEYQQAIDFHQQSLAIMHEIGNRQGEGASLTNLGNAYFSLGQYQQAIDFHQQSLVIMHEIGNRQGKARSLSNLGLALLHQHDLPASEGILRQSIDIDEAIRSDLDINTTQKVSIFETQKGTYHLLQKVLVLQDKTNQALEVAERGRARALAELLALEHSNTAYSPIATAQIQQIARDQNATLVQYSVIYDDFQFNGRSQPKESEIYIWVIQPTGEVTFRNVDLKPLWQQQESSLAELVAASRNEIGVKGRGGASGEDVGEDTGENAGEDATSRAHQSRKLQQLHQLLIDPIADLLPANPDERVILIPQDVLYLVPFAALQDANHTYLIEKHTLQTAPSIQVLALTRQSRERQSIREDSKIGLPALVMGNPTMPEMTTSWQKPPTKLPSLPGAEREAQQIAQLYNVQPLLGDEATETTVKQQLPGASPIHLATHGLLDGFLVHQARTEGRQAFLDTLDNPGAIALAPSKTDDGLLTVREIAAMELQADLVVLSACNTGRGKLAGEGVVGLSRAFLVAGVPSVVVSLWKVDDDATAYLMAAFYRQLSHNGNKADALRQAMLQTLTEYPDEKHWAAFTLIGEAE